MVKGSAVKVQRSRVHTAEKSLVSRLSHVVTVPETDTGGLAEEAKGSGRTLAKELGKIAP